MSEQGKQRPRGVLGEEVIGPFEWIRDRLYDFVNIEGDFALQFMADFIRGPEPAREENHLKRQMQFQAEKGQHSSLRNVKKARPGQGKPLSKVEQTIFVDLLKRKPSEKQVPYWKRKKALLNNPSKRELVLQHAASLELAAKQKVGTIEIAAGSFSLPTKQKQTVRKSQKR